MDDLIGDSDDHHHSEERCKQAHHIEQTVADAIGALSSRSRSGSGGQRSRESDSAAHQLRAYAMAHRSQTSSPHFHTQSRAALLPFAFTSLSQRSSDVHRIDTNGAHKGVILGS